MDKAKVKLGLSVKFIIAITILLVSGISILGIYFINHEKRIIRENLEERGLSLANNLAYNSEYGMLTANIDILSNLVAGTMRQPDVAYCIIQDLDGKQLVSKGEENKIAIPDEISNSAQGVQEPLIQYVSIPGGQSYYEFSVPVKTKAEAATKDEEVFFQGTGQTIEKKIGVVRVGISLARAGILFKQIQQAIIFIIIVIVLAAGIVAVFLTRAVLAPIKKLVEATQRVASGDLTFKVSVRTRDEIGTLADSFNKMIDDLQKITVSRDELAKEISERKRTEAALRESESKHRMLITNIPQKIFYKDLNLIYILCNDSYARELNIKPEEIKGKTDYDFYPEELAKKHIADDKRIIQSGKMEEMEEEYIKEGQKFIIQTIKAPVKEEQGNIIGIFGIFWDITERKKAEEQQKLLLKDLEDTNRIMVGRELKMIELKKEINRLSQELGRPAPYGEATLGG